MSDNVREALDAIAALSGAKHSDASDELLEAFDRLIAHVRAQALRDAATAIPEVGAVLRGMAARVEGGGDE